ncbi:hypothetical protein A2837_00140 [Candidatus Kaiserbacteria bacterium RIFCSPHIGHO2_01_FULL_46_22]|uniref:Uncharacterized protein n=1 Tax=Candidatus Kaiserbacteria bacterium RIFCSPHIGHO2_01_FULL_46_22 TaxID=1798475 RepID=A0A1F6BXG2_9BACT|nr:MAG: hypothetical protein A2837_00140 [Candidatus Kaiserbacteria bacterium RIFCSPHIGHO2_01_FULL_46_22]
MEPNIQSKLGEIEAKIDAVYASAEKTRRYFQITMWVTIVAVGLPFIGLLLAIPVFVNNYTAAMNGLI